MHHSHQSSPAPGARCCTRQRHGALPLCRPSRSAFSGSAAAGVAGAVEPAAAAFAAEETPGLGWWPEAESRGCRRSRLDGDDEEAWAFGLIIGGRSDYFADGRARLARGGQGPLGLGPARNASAQPVTASNSSLPNSKTLPYRSIQYPPAAAVFTLTWQQTRCRRLRSTLLPLCKMPFPRPGTGGPQRFPQGVPCVRAGSRRRSGSLGTEVFKHGKRHVRLDPTRCHGIYQDVMRREFGGK